jgi:hypothetical protein
MRALRVAPILLLLPGCALHSTAPIARDQWAQVTSVPPGTVVRVWSAEAAAGNARHQRDKGILVKADEAEVQILARTGQLRLARAQVRRIDVLIGGGDSVKNGALIGAAAGGAYGLVVWYLLRGEFEGNGLIAPIMTAAIGGCIGAVIDAIVRGDETRTVYRTSHQ